MLAKWVLLVGSEQGMPTAQVPAFFIRTSRSCFSDIELIGCVGVLYDNEEIDRRPRHQQLERASHLSALVETTTLNQ